MTAQFKYLHELNPLLPFIAPSVPRYWEIVLDRVNIVYRHEWGAKTPMRRDFLDLPIYNIVFVFNPGVPPCDSHKSCVRNIREHQAMEFKKVGKPDIKQNFLIGDNGVAYEGRGWRIQGMGPDKYFNLDNKCLTIGFMGDYTNGDPGFLMWATAFKLIALGIDVDFIKRHFDVAVSRIAE